MVLRVAMTLAAIVETSAVTASVSETIHQAPTEGQCGFASVESAL